MAGFLRYQAVIFDLDGTLLDSLDDLADSMNAALERQGFPTHPVEKYRYFVGDGITELARRVLPPEQRNKAMVEDSVRQMSEEYAKRWACKTRPYPGMEDALDELAATGVRMAVLSNKPDAFTKKMIPALLPRWNFYPILGARPGVPVKPDPASALEIAALLGLPPSQIMYVGDTAIDMMTANMAGMFAVGVAWGFREVPELIEHGAQAVVKVPVELLKLLVE